MKVENVRIGIEVRWVATEDYSLGKLRVEVGVDNVEV